MDAGDRFLRAFQERFWAERDPTCRQILIRELAESLGVPLAVPRTAAGAAKAGPAEAGRCG